MLDWFTPSVQLSATDPHTPDVLRISAEAMSTPHTFIDNCDAVRVEPLTLALVTPTACFSGSVNDTTRRNGKFLSLERSHFTEVMVAGKFGAKVVVVVVVVVAGAAVVEGVDGVDGCDGVVPPHPPGVTP